MVAQIFTKVIYPVLAYFYLLADSSLYHLSDHSCKSEASKANRTENMKVTYHGKLDTVKL